MKEKITTTTYKYDEKGNLIEKVEQIIERGNEISSPPIVPTQKEKKTYPNIPSPTTPIGSGTWEPYKEWWANAVSSTVGE